ncbi:hypothetical protein FLW53_09310 [Microbispora sp. SCL1-1]|uniref:hypothetical protein n=1 Tax=unclassified Microbispora TaxID=2614687 RepID=UPI00115B7706|nr:MULTISPECIES: hypothetical protein [unclassified Microbispora]NJP24396.1 hypothetical protein [Microbispora sp. CL1-1]TQS14550.1 hypothetical protein FLW53_09310 [Microbispora sp. SCL1-1]
MSRFINWILTAVAVTAWGALVVDGIHPADLFNEDATILLCIAACLPSVVVAIRRHTARIKTVLAAEFAASRADTRQALDELGDRLCKRTLEAAMETLLRAQVGATMEHADHVADRFRLTDTGPFRMTR